MTRQVNDRNPIACVLEDLARLFEDHLSKEPDSEEKMRSQELIRRVHDQLAMSARAYGPYRGPDGKPFGFEEHMAAGKKK